MNPSLISTLLRSQENRLITLRSPLPEAGLILDSFGGREAVSEPFAFTLDLLSEQGDLDLKAFLGKAMGLALKTADGSLRHFHGHVTSFHHAGTDGGLARYQATLGPWTDFLTHRFNCKLFQNKTLPAILREVFSAYWHLARTEFRLRNEDYDPITFCAQYQESDFQFVSRLMEGHGIHYFYRFEAEGHSLVLCDNALLAENMPQAHRIPFNAIPGAAKEDTIDAWEDLTQVVPTAAASKTFDFKSPMQPRDAEVKSRHAGGLPPMEDYRYAGAYAYADLQGAKDYVNGQRDENDARFETFQGASNCRNFTCGRVFELLDHYRQGPTSHDRRFFVTSVTHTGHNNYLNQTTPADYRNTFTAISVLATYRPPRRTPLPRIHGPQTARVVGPPGEEIHCDNFGRVKVQFHWDRLGGFDAESSCWVRVSSPWAGNNFGIMAVPRVGSEVVVEFLDGNPDHPIVTGHMWNFLRNPPWPLPANRTQTGILTRSTREGRYENANALRFEDRKGEEEVWLHAEKNQRIEVENDESHSVDHDRLKTIGNDETTEVKHDRTERVGNDERITIGMNRTEHVGLDESVAIGANQKLNVGASQSISVGQTKYEKVLMASTELVGGVRTLTIGEGYVVAVGLGAFEEVGLGKETHVGNTYLIKAGDQLEIRVGKSSLIMDKDGKITLAGTEVNIHGEGPVKVLGKNVNIN